MQREFKGIWIPKKIWLSEDLGWTEKFLLTEIDSLSKSNECFATNEYFAKFFKISKDHVSKIISSLSKKGYVEVNLVYKPGTKQVEKRVITTIGYRQKQLEGIEENDDTPIGKNNEDINTVINNTNNNAYSNEFEQFWMTYPRKIDKKKAYKSFKTACKAYPLQSILEGTEKYAKQVRNVETKFIKHPATFLNNESFVDGYEEQQEKPTPPSFEEKESVLAGMWGDD